MDEPQAVIEELLDTLESCVEQFMVYSGHVYQHDFMSTGQMMTRVLARYRPDRWEDVHAGLRFIGER